MPSISMFYGIIVYMYFIDNSKHHAPHIHAKYAEYEVVLSIPSAEVLEGFIPPAKKKIDGDTLNLPQFDARSLKGTIVPKESEHVDQKKAGIQPRV